ncbi:MAG: MoxR family ATPase [Peptococcaceae bacterium]|nr:MoxR family ATPase [Peptococcaceae bacterium]
MMTIEEIREGLWVADYIASTEICYVVFEALVLNKPILIEGDPGVGKTSLAKAVARMLELPFLRLQMYDGLTKEDILYDYDYQRQLLTLEAVKPKITEKIQDLDVNAAIRAVASDVDFYGREFLIPRPILKTIDGSGRKLLLIDEIDKASEEIEYMLYEYLENYQINIPQYGAIQCPEDQKPLVFLTSNGYRELSGAMKRRCGYLYIKKKTRQEIVEILKRQCLASDQVAEGVAACVVALQEKDLKHPVSVAEAIDWTHFLRDHATQDMVAQSIGLLAKDRRDMETIRTVVEAHVAELAGEHAEET